MTCLNCGEKKSIQAHLIPKAFVMEVKRYRGEQHLIVYEGVERPIVSNTGLFDRGILCGACDGVLGSHEGYVFKLLKRSRQIKKPFGSIIGVDPLEGDTVVRFAAGIAWKFAVTTPERGRIKLGPYEALLRDIALRAAPIPPSVDVTMIRIVEMDGDVYHYRAPLLDRKDHANVVRFSVGSFVFFLKVDKRPYGSTLPPEAWLRGRTAGTFIIAPADVFEEGKLHAELARQAPTRRFFAAMMERSSSAR
ncbi:hypothetical protein ELH93_07155 [Rhizobium leguminosarum]|uniref:hypothetical protein n=1 Tax=Rhizobium leguminosarum TaxID=384 RepID=UPI00103235D2|nr:hypothetical protein [Rhizobium leguminosarum]TAY32398.1 hypothetical protein ELH93_07155 [Rhizobium leguminosarum]